jgi:hypothetical protein
MTHTHTHKISLSLRKTPLDEESAPSNTQISREADNLAPSGARSHNPRKRAAANLRLRPRGHRDRLAARVARRIYLVDGKERGRIRKLCSATGISV